MRAVGGRTFRGHPVVLASRAAAVPSCVVCVRATSPARPAHGRPPPSRPRCPPSAHSVPPATPEARARGLSWAECIQSYICGLQSALRPTKAPARGPRRRLVCRVAPRACCRGSDISRAPGRAGEPCGRRSLLCGVRPRDFANPPCPRPPPAIPPALPPVRLVGAARHARSPRAGAFVGRLLSMAWPKRPLRRLAAALRGRESLKITKSCLTENCPLRALFYPFLGCIGVKMIRTFSIPQNTFLRSSLTPLRLFSEIWRFRKFHLPLPPACSTRSLPGLPGFPAGPTSYGFLQ